ncbi:MAG: hypothetical protein [Vetruanivirus porcinprimi]|uniref:Uncharacterized protein n=1 Tax=phage Lak_Megaphage_RVC_AP1_GC26 TaxID=3109224 RepID=A0ABZ0Z687_9CAUD|nr:MAG: hypothetical protein [phage Lak_Megaphage_RVC_AP1_GC26]
MKKHFFKRIGIVIISIICIIIGAIFFMICWNYVMPFVFGLPKITYIHAMCLMAILRLLFPINSSSNK